MISGRVLLSRSAPWLACLGLLAVWQAGSLNLDTDSFPTALDAIRAIPSILGDKESLINILASLRRMAIGFVVTKGPAAIVTMTGVVCGPNGTRASHCVGQHDPQWVFGQDDSFDALWNRIAQHGGNPLTATPFQRVAGRWYLDLTPAPAG